MYDEILPAPVPLVSVNLRGGKQQDTCLLTDFPPLRNAGSSSPSKHRAIKSNNSAAPANHTLRSQGDGLVIIIKPIGEHAETFLKNPITLARAIKNSPFARNECSDLRVNNRRNILCIQLKEQNDKLISELLTVKNIGKWSIHCYQPANDVASYGVIGPVHPDIDVNDIKNSLHTGEENIKIVDLVRMDHFHTGQKKPSSSIKVQFNSKSPPKKVYLDMISYPVREFCPPPLRCFRCQRLGHSASGCTSDIRCLLCAGNHNKDSCSAQILKCANCAKPHKASSNECQYIVKAKEIQKLRIGGMSYKQAEDTVTLNSQSLPHREEMSEGANIHLVDNLIDIHNSQGSHSPSIQHPSAIIENRWTSKTSQPLTFPNSKEPDTAVHHESCSWNESKIEAIVTRKIEQITREIRDENCRLVQGIGKLLNDVFSVKLHQEGTRERKLLLISMIRNNFGDNIGQTLQKEWEQTNSSSLPSERVPANTDEDTTDCSHSDEFIEDDVLLAPTQESSPSPVIVTTKRKKNVKTSQKGKNKRRNVK